MGEVERDPCKSFSPTSLLKQGSLEHFTQHFLELWLQLFHCSGFSLVITAVQDSNKWKIGCKSPFFFNFKENSILYDTINEAHMLQIPFPFIFSHLCFLLGYNITITFYNSG